MDRQTALVTGGSSGIGAELAAVFAREGFNVVLVARGEKALQERAGEFTSRYGVDVKVMAKDLALPGARTNLPAR
jgi:short-subunit dehydrogenase